MGIMPCHSHLYHKPACFLILFLLRIHIKHWVQCNASVNRLQELQAHEVVNVENSAGIILFWGVLTKWT